jgi:hypothetical protein
MGCGVGSADLPKCQTRRVCPTIPTMMGRALAAHLRHAINSDPYPLAPRLAPLRAILDKLDPPAPRPETMAAVARRHGAERRSREAETIMTLWLPVLTGLLTGLTALASIWLGSRLSRTKDEQQWLRDRRLEAYADVIRAAEMVLSEAWRVFYRAVDPRTHLPILSEKLSQFYHALSRASLIGSPELQKTCDELFKLYLDITQRVTANAENSTALSEVELGEFASKSAVVSGRFRIQAQNDLPAGSRTRWKTLSMLILKLRHRGRRTK